MVKIDTELPGVFLIEPRVYRDARGFFCETYRASWLREAGVDTVFVQDNHSSSLRGTLRGLHYQLRHPQAKLCRVVRGAVLDVVVDIRRGSPTFGRSVQAELSEANGRMIFIPRGCAHGYAVLAERADFLYKCDDYYDPADEHGIVWNDPDLQVAWGLDAPVLSRKDASLPALAALDAAALPVYAH